MGTVHSAEEYRARRADVLAEGGEPPHDGGMEARIDRLDRVVERIDTDLTSIKVSVGKIETQMSHVATKTWIMGAVIIVLIAILGSVWGGLAWVAQQYLAPLLHASGK